MHTMTILEAFAQELARLTRCVNRDDIAADASQAIAFLARNFLPRGSGFDNGTTMDISRSREDCFFFTTSFHHMDDNGSYDGWTDHTVTIRPSFWNGCAITVSGQNRNDIKDYIHEQFAYALRQNIAPVFDKENARTGYRFVFKKTTTDNSTNVKTVRYSFDELEG